MNSQNLKASVSFVGDGTTNKFYFGFDYINKQFVKVQIGNEGQSLTYPSDYTVDDRSVVLKDTPAVGVAIRVYRETSSDRIVEWADGAFIKASQMTLENLQQLHLIEEAQDYPILNSLSRYPDGINFNALGSRVINVSDPTDPQDVVTKHYMENVQGGFVADNTKILNEAKDTLSATQQTQSKAQTNETLSKAWATSTESPDNTEDTQSSTGKTQSSRSWSLYSKGKAQEAATSATNAKTQADTATTQATNAATYASQSASSASASAMSASNAKTSETNAKASETKALTSEQNAKASETNAKTSETKALSSENSARSHEQSAYSYVTTAQSWAESEGSPDGKDDSLSTTGKTKSAKGWAMQAKDYAGSLDLSFIINAVLPVGAIIEFINDTDPNELYPGTTWVKMDAGRVLISAGTYTEGNTTYTYNLGDTGGEAKHQLSTEELAEHDHDGGTSTANLTGTWSTSNSQGLSNSPDNSFSGIIKGSDWSGNTHSGSNGNKTPKTITINAIHTHTFTTSSVGGNASHENRMPYQVINRWKRTA